MTRFFTTEEVRQQSFQCEDDTETKIIPMLDAAAANLLQMYQVIYNWCCRFFSNLFFLLKFSDPVSFHFDTIAHDPDAQNSSTVAKEPEAKVCLVARVRFSELDILMYREIMHIPSWISNIRVTLCFNHSGLMKISHLLEISTIFPHCLVRKQVCACSFNSCFIFIVFQFSSQLATIGSSNNIVCRALMQFLSKSSK